MNNIFKHTEMPRLDVNRFDLSHDVKQSFDMGQLIPTLTMECLPGDKFNIRPENLLRFAPLVSPVMHNIIVDTHFFFVPNRILWDEWEDFITGETEPIPPQITSLLNVSPGDLGDYLGQPTDVALSQFNRTISAFPTAAYALIYDEYYRDQNIQAEAFQPLLPGAVNVWCTILNYGLPLRRAWNHDYFTSCLPFAQKGDPVTLPLLNNANAVIELSPTYASDNPKFVDAVGGQLAGDVLGTGGTGVTVGGIGATYDPDGSLIVDVNDEASDITTIRRAFRLQEFLEKDARGGTRYIENIYSHFGVHSQDKRLQRPEYIGGTKQQMVISEVLSATETLNSSDVTVNPVGQMAGHGISVGGGNNITYSCKEHGYIMGIMSVRPRTAYQQGMHKHYTRVDRLDYAWPTFANIGEQAVKVFEIYFDATDEELDETFGYIPRYSEYKYMNSRVAGDMRTTLDFWHLGRKFTSKPLLNSNFIECNPDKRIFAVPSEHGIYAHIIYNISAIRKLPRFSTPSI